MAVDLSFACDLLEISTGHTLSSPFLKSVKKRLQDHGIDPESNLTLILADVQVNAEGSFKRLGLECFSPLDSFISQGAFGKVYKVKHLESGTEYALKKTTKTHCLPDLAKTELKIHTTFNPDFIVQAFFAWQEPKYMYIALELMQCSLHDLLVRKLPTVDTKCIWWNLIGQMGNALSYLHSNNYLHGDIKPANMLISSTSQLKISDFGNSQYCDKGKSVYYSGGTKLYYAPENFAPGPKSHGRSSFASEWFSFGLVCYDMLHPGHANLIPKNVAVLGFEHFLKSSSKIANALRILPPEERLFVEQFLKIRTDIRASYSIDRVPLAYRNYVAMTLDKFHRNYGHFICKAEETVRILSEVEGYPSSEFLLNKNLDHKIQFAGFYFPKENCANTLKKLEAEKSNLVSQNATKETLIYSLQKKIDTQDAQQQSMQEQIDKLQAENEKLRRELAQKHAELAELQLIGRNQDVANSAVLIPPSTLDHENSDGEELERPKQHICGLCKKSYKSVSSYNKHKKLVHSGKIYRCSYTGCESTFTTEEGLGLHVNKVHTKKQKYPCRKCKAKFLDRNNRNHHEKKCNK